MDHDFPTLINRGAPRCTVKRLKLKSDKLLSNMAFNFNLRRYTMVGEVPFFMSIGQPYTVKARSTSDATCLLLSKLDFEAGAYPGCNFRST